ncbi:MAG: hypothetical protein GX974_06310 [Clostridiales bacterium]|nr:hypothetical protein [Clostridiales bacterium]
MAPNISILIFAPEYSNLLQRCLEKIAETTTLSYEIMLLSPRPLNVNLDKSEKPADIQFITCSNLSINKAYNKGFLYSKSDNIVIISPEIMVKHNWDVHIMKYAKIRSNIGFVGKLKKPISSTIMETSDFYITEALDDSCLLIKRFVVDIIGDFDEKFSSTSFMFDDYFLRARQSGFELSYCKEDLFRRSFSAEIGDNIDYLDTYLDNRNRFVEKWRRFLPIKNDIISEVLLNTVLIEEEHILYLGDDPIIPNTLERRGYIVRSISRSHGYSPLMKDNQRYNAIIIFDNITHEQTLFSLLDQAKSILMPKGLLFINIHNSLYIDRVYEIFRGNFTISHFDPNLKYPFYCLSKPEIMSSNKVSHLELVYLAGFTSKPSPEVQGILKEICNAGPAKNHLKEEFCTEEYLAIWQKN